MFRHQSRKKFWTFKSQFLVLVGTTFVTFSELALPQSCDTSASLVVDSGQSCGQIAFINPNNAALTVNPLGTIQSPAGTTPVYISGGLMGSITNSGLISDTHSSSATPSLVVTGSVDSLTNNSTGVIGNSQDINFSIQVSGNGNNINQLSNSGKIYGLAFYGSGSNTSLLPGVSTLTNNLNGTIYAPFSAPSNAAIFTSNGQLGQVNNLGTIKGVSINGGSFQILENSNTGVISSSGSGISISATTLNGTVYGSTLTTLNNAGLISSTSTSVGNPAFGVVATSSIGNSSIGTINNSGTIYGQSGVGARGGQISNINNSGLIYGNSGAVGGVLIGAQALSSMGVITNIGTILADGVGSYGIWNKNTTPGSLATLNNLQGIGTYYSPVGVSSTTASNALTYSGTLPTNYNIILNSPSQFGQFSYLSSSVAQSGSMAFNIYGNAGTNLVTGVSASTITAGTYADILQGFVGTLSGTTISGSGFSITGTSGTYGGMNYNLVADSSHSGYWSLSVASAITNATNILSGSTNLLSAVGSSLNPVLDGGTLKIDAAGPNSTAFTLTTNNGVIDHNGLNATLAGNITDATAGSPGRLRIVNGGISGQGTLVLSGTNTYSGGTEVDAGARLSISSANNIGTGDLVLVGTSSAPAVLNVTATTTIANNITVAGDPVFNIATGTTATVSSPISNGVSAGDVVVAGGGTLALTAANTYTGLTNVNAGSTLALSGSGAIATSSAANVDGIFDISQSSSGVSVKSLNDGSIGGGTGAVNLGGNTVTAGSTGGSGNFSGVIADGGIAAGTGGSLAITGAGYIQTLSGVNTYTGSTTIGSGASLALSGSGSVATSSGVVDSGTFDISNTTSGASIKAISGTGALALGTKNLSVTNAAGNLSGAVTGSGAINITGGNQTLSGNNSTFTGGVQVQSSAALTIPAASALGSGALALVGSSSVPSTLNVTGTTTIANAITVAGDPVFNVATGTTTTVSSPITNGGVAGDVVVAGGGILNLTAVNTYTGTTSIGSGSTLALADAGSIATSSGLTNNGTFNVSNKTGNVSVASYNQGSTGALLMGFAPTNNQRVNVAGAASLAGSLSLFAGAGTYSAGKYTLFTANGVSGTFGSFSSNLNTYTSLAYSLSYDANDVYLNLFSSGPTTADTQQSLVNTSQALQNTYTLQNSVLANSFSYDCNEFGANGICISAGGRNTAVSAANGLNNTSALLIAAYRPHPNYRIGAYADQNLSVNNSGSTVNLGNNTPLVGVFGAWNERLDGAGTEVKVSAAYGQKNTTVTRQVVGTSQPGSGGAPIDSQGAQVTAKYGFGLTENIIVSPYVGMRYTQNNMNGYTEAASSTVTAPLTYSALNTNATTALAGMGASYRFIPQATAFVSAGVESDTNTSNGTYSATGVSGLTPINFNANPVKTRPTAMLGAYYDVVKNQRLGITGIYRQEPYQGVSTTTVMATYTIGM